MSSSITGEASWPPALSPALQPPCYGITEREGRGVTWKEAPPIHPRNHSSASTYPFTPQCVLPCLYLPSASHSPMYPSLSFVSCIHTSICPSTVAYLHRRVSIRALIHPQACLHPLFLYPSIHPSVLTSIPLLTLFKSPSIHPARHPRVAAVAASRRMAFGGWSHCCVPFLAGGGGTVKVPVTLLTPATLVKVHVSWR